VNIENRQKAPSPKIVSRPHRWERFERAVDAGVKADPQHWTAKSKTRPASKGRIHKGKARS